MDNVSIRDYYEERYLSEQEQAFPPDPSRYRAWLRSLLASSGSSRGVMIDFGCGVGYVCSMLADHGFDVVGVEISSAAVSLARAREPRVAFIQWPPDGVLPFPDDSIDGITCLGVLEHIPDPMPILQELHRLARPDAVAIWVVPNARSPYFWFGHGTGQVEEHPRSLEGWRDLLATAGWTIEHVRRDPGPIDRTTADWKRLLQRTLNRLPLALTYQFVIETRAATTA